MCACQEREYMASITKTDNYKGYQMIKKHIFKMAQVSIFAVACMHMWAPYVAGAAKTQSVVKTRCSLRELCSALCNALASKWRAHPRATLQSVPITTANDDLVNIQDIVNSSWREPRTPSRESDGRITQSYAYDWGWSDEI